MYVLYKIYYGNNLMYLGRTGQKLQDRLRGHFFKKIHLREIDINLVSKIEYAELETQADLFVYECYFINKLKPPLNNDDKARDNLTIELPELEFKEFYCYLFDKWKLEINLRDHKYKEEKKEQLRINEVYSIERKKKREALSRKEISQKEYEDWLDDQESKIGMILKKKF